MPTTWTIPGPILKDLLVQHAQESLPRWWSKSERGLEDINAIAEVMVTVLLQCEDWLRMTFILDSDGKWLIQHARDRGVSPQANESEATLKERIRRPEEAVTRGAILAVVNAVLVAAGLPGTATMIELPRDACFCLATPATPADAEGYGFAASTGGAIVGSRIAFSRGGSMVILLPVGTPQAVQLAIRDAVRIKKAGGFGYSIEVLTT